MCGAQHTLVCILLSITDALRKTATDRLGALL